MSEQEPTIKPGGYARVRTICPYTGMIGRIVSMHGSSAVLQFDDAYVARSNRSTGASGGRRTTHWVQSWFSKNELWPETKAAYEAQHKERYEKFNAQEAAEEEERARQVALEDGEAS